MKNFDNSYLSASVKYIAGVDEAGRGPLAGPVVSAAVIFSEDTFIEGVNDSKKLTEKKREELFPQILSKSLAYSVSAVSHGIIDKINILQASLLSMSISVMRLKICPDLVLVDGNKSFPLQVHPDCRHLKCNTNIAVIPIVKGDSKSFAIACASIIAKVTRDRIMKRLNEYYPDYLWYKNKGYPTKEHINAILKAGPSPLHRKTFLKRILAEG